jgi:hypothetical protein
MRGEAVDFKVRWPVSNDVETLKAELAAMKAEVESLRAWKAAVLAATAAN